MDFIQEHDTAQEIYDQAYHALVEKWGGDPDDTAMTLAEEIGLPRMFRDPWGVYEKVVDKYMWSVTLDVALAYAQLTVLGEIKSVFYIQMKAKEGEDLYVQIAKDSDHLAKLDILRTNLANIEREINIRHDAYGFPPPSTYFMD